MIDPLLMRRLGYHALLLGLAACIIFVRMLPLSTQTVAIPGPDLIMALVFAWALRRPDYVPVVLVAALIFLTDMLFQRPPGLRAALVVLGLEFLRSRASFSRDMPFAVEWLMVSVVMTAILLVERSVLAVVFVEQVSLGKSVIRLIGTWAIYPVVVLASVYLFGVRRVLPSDLDGMRVPT